MSPIIFEFIRAMAAVIFCAIAVKLADDFLDQEMDMEAGCSNWTCYLGKGTMLYGMLFLSLAVSINAEVSMPLFLGSYMVGMFHDLTRTFPSRLCGWQESVLVFVIGSFLFDGAKMAFSLFFILSVQLFDDLIDLQQDEMCGRRNVAHRIGKTACLLLVVLSLLLSWRINQAMFSSVFCGTAIFYGSLLYYQGRKIW